MIKHDGILAIDLETTGLWPRSIHGREGREADRPFGFGLCNSELETAYWQAEVDPKTRRVRYRSVSQEMNWLRRMAKQKDLTWVLHNAPFDLLHLRALGIHLRGEIVDTMVMAHTADSAEMRFGLKPLAKKYLELDDDDQTSLLAQVKQRRRERKKDGWAIATKETHGKDPVKADYWLGDRELVERYCRLDAYRTMLLYLMYRDILNDIDHGRLWKVYRREMKLMGVMSEMAEHGMRVHPDKVEELTLFYRDYMAEQKARMAACGHAELNPQSHVQLSRIFCIGKGLKAEKLTDKGNPQIDGDQLRIWARGPSKNQAEVSTDEPDGEDGEPLARAVLEWRAAKKSLEYLSSYDFFRVQDEVDGLWRIHPVFNQVAARTGRLAAKEPNIMQVASATTGRRHSFIEPREREVFGPAPGRLWYLPDYSQLEVWVFAFATGDDSMTRPLMEGFDFHSFVAEQAFGHLSDFEERKKFYRKRAKIIMFCRLYGGGVKKIAEEMRVSVPEGRRFLEMYDTRLPAVSAFMEATVSRVKRTLQMSNHFGRRYFFDANFAYKAVNYYIQGGCADLLKRAMIRLARRLKSRWCGEPGEFEGAQLVTPVHDEIIIDVPEEYHSLQLMREIAHDMQVDSHVVGVPIPLPVGFKMTRTLWNEAKEVGTFGGPNPTLCLAA